MLVYRQRLGEVIRKVVDAGNMLHAELPLSDAVLEPVETHIDAFGGFRREGPVSQTDSELVVAQNGRRGLGVAQVVQDAALFDGDFGGGKKTPVGYPGRVLCMQYHSTLQYPFVFVLRQVNG